MCSPFPVSFALFGYRWGTDRRLTKSPDSESAWRVTVGPEPAGNPSGRCLKAHAVSVQAHDAVVRLGLEEPISNEIWLPGFCVRRVPGCQTIVPHGPRSPANSLKALRGADAQTFCRPLPYHLGTAPYCRVEKASRPRGSSAEIWSGRRGSNPRHRPWQGRALPLSYSRSPNLIINNRTTLQQ